MGGALVRNPPLRRMIEKTVAELKIRTFVETGTSNGITSIWAANLFDDVYTIEIDIDKALALVDDFKGHPNIHTFYGDSGELIKPIVMGMTRGEKVYPGIHEPAIFWLDAHGPDYQPPLLEELQVVFDHPYDDIIYIDDAQYYWLQCFVQWPTMDEIRNLLDGYALALVADAMIAYPPKWGKFMRTLTESERRSTYIPEEGIG